MSIPEGAMPRTTSAYRESERQLNPLLSRVMGRLRRDRSLFRPDQTFYVRIDNAMGGDFAQVWFQTRGCTWDRRGACTMCNYGQSAEIAPSDMALFVAEALDSIDVELAELYVSPSGSLLDPIEVPPAARQAIYDIVNRFPVSKFSFETRAETITPEVVDELVESMPTKRIAVGFGLESVDPWVLRFCINKAGGRDAFTRAARLLHDRGVEVYANVALGSAFLNPREAIDDAVRSVEWSLRNGADLALLFPMHIKTNTLLAWLYERGQYEPPSLWSLIEVLNTVDTELLSQLTISWYRSDYGDDSSMIASPTTCPSCETEVMESLDAFRASASSGTLGSLMSLDCGCRAEWRDQIAVRPEEGLGERVYANYTAIAESFDLEDWWATHSEEVRDQLLGT